RQLAMVFDNRGGPNMTDTMMRIKAVVAVILGVWMMALAVPAMAQEVPPEQLALARKYVDLTDSASVFEVTMVEIGVGTMRQIVQQNPDLSEQANTAVGKILEEYRDRKSELFDQFARIYAVRFTIEELQQIVGFYESSAGQKLAQANSDVNSELQAVLQVFTNNARPEFFAKVRAELRAQGFTL
ncbi:MAG: DUF2059 domain-containing protein, partial [Candidatus Devosia euplotis]|nr:DUF2059 domain-containing protein [Candidatus Devosia euplotis]